MNEPTPDRRADPPVGADLGRAVLAHRWGPALVGATAVVAYFMAGQLLPGVALALVTPRDQIEAALVRSLMPIMCWSAMVAAGLVGFLHLAGLLSPRPAPARWPALWVAGLIPLMFAGKLAIGALQDWAGIAVEEQQALVDAAQAVPSPLLFLGIVVAAPLAEELIFRRALHGSLRARHGTASALAVSSLVFALVHLHPPAFLIYLWMGACLAVVYEKTGSVWAAVAVHAGNNALGFVFLTR